jgi:hypothetical protein
MAEANPLTHAYSFLSTSKARLFDPKKPIQEWIDLALAIEGEFLHHCKSHCCCMQVRHRETRPTPNMMKIRWSTAM